MPVETERLLLRPWHEDDHPELERLLSDPAVRDGRHSPPERVARPSGPLETGCASRRTSRKWEPHGDVSRSRDSLLQTHREKPDDDSTSRTCRHRRASRPRLRNQG